MSHNLTKAAGYSVALASLALGIIGAGFVSVAGLVRAKFWCKLFGHKLRIVQVFSQSARKCQCVRCDTYFAMEDRYQAFLEWDADFEELYATIYGLGRTIR